MPPDERTALGRARLPLLGRTVTWIGDHWWLLVGLAALMLGIVDVVSGNAETAVVVLLLGLVLISVALFVGPRRMVSRPAGRRIGFVLEYASFCALWIAVALSHRPPIDNHGPWFDSGGIVLGAVVLVGAVGVARAVAPVDASRACELSAAGQRVDAL